MFDVLDWIARIRRGGIFGNAFLHSLFLFMVTLFLELVQAVMLMLTLPCHGVETPGLVVNLDEREHDVQGILLHHRLKSPFDFRQASSYHDIISGPDSNLMDKVLVQSNPPLI